ncbi:ABC transporter substrate-binding protein [Tepidiforma sp.]|uniref:ABC transporter substrate-binding protein n=1 Tax=Tepidiforma sp. TaxID=2682230 RepID=UPI002ADD8174|nr:ABC transporter substrate-binding protein [Tepidiforma sp.]
MPLRLRTLLVALIAASLALLAVACGGDGNDRPTVRLGYSAWPGWFPWYIAEEEGLFEQAGANVDLVYFEGYLDSINALAAGQLDANSQTLNDTIASVAAGSDQVIVLVNDNSTGNDAIIVAEGINSVADLKGRRIALEVGVVDHYLLLLGLAEAGLSADDVGIVNLETGAAAAAFAAGQVDAVAVFAPFTTQALSRPGSKVLFDSADFPGAISDHLVVSHKLVEEHPEAVQGLVDAWFLTLEWMAANPDRALELLARRAGVSGEEYRAYEAGTTIFTLEQNLAAFQPGNDLTSLPFAAARIQQFLLETGLIEKEVDLSRLFDDRFVRARAGGAE